MSILKSHGSIWKINGTIVDMTNSEQTITIGGIEYPVVKIGNQLWIQKNLENEIGTLNNDYRVYDKEKYGLLYKEQYIRTGSIKDFLDQVRIDTGFHLPSNSDLASLRNYCSSEGYFFPQCIKAIDGWNSNNGTNETGLTLYGSGDYNGSNIEHIGDYFHGAKEESSSQWYVSSGTSYDFTPGTLPYYIFVAIRLMKDDSQRLVPV